MVLVKFNLQRNLLGDTLFSMKDEVTHTVYHFKTHPEGDIKIRSICLFGEEIQTPKSIIPRTNGQQKYLSSGLPVARYSQLLVSFGLCGNRTSIHDARHGPMTKSEKLLKMLVNRISLAMFFQDWFVLFEIPLEQTPHQGQDVSSLPTKADPGAILPDPDVCIFRAREDKSAIRRVMAAEHSPCLTGWHSRKATRLEG